MPKIKRLMQLIAGIVGTAGYAISLVFSIIAFITVFLILTGLSEMGYNFYESYGGSLVVPIILAVLGLGLGITLLVLSIKLIKNPNKTGDFKKRKTLVIVALVFNGIYLVFSVFNNILELLIPIAVIVLLILSLCLGNHDAPEEYNPEEETYKQPQTYARPAQPQVPPTPPRPAQPQVETSDARIARIKKLQQEGIISAEESVVPVMVVPTNEEIMIVKDTYSFIA